MMQPYKGYFIEGSALLVHPFSPDWYVGGTVLVAGRSTSIVEITRFHLFNAAKQVGVTSPPNLLARVDKVDKVIRTKRF